MAQRDFALGRPGPAEVTTPEPSRLGPDPEPVGCRFEALVRPLAGTTRRGRPPIVPARRGA